MDLRVPAAPALTGPSRRGRARPVAVAAGVVAALLAAGCAGTPAPPSAPASAPPSPAPASAPPSAGALSGVTVPDAYTPVVVRPLSASTFPFPGSDGKLHIVYDLELVNASRVPA